MDTRTNISGLEELILLAIASLDGRAYAAAIQRALNRVRRHVSDGSLRVTLARLQDKGFIAVHEAADSDEVPARRGGKPRRLFVVTAAGAEDLKTREWARQSLRANSSGSLIE